MDDYDYDYDYDYDEPEPEQLYPHARPCSTGCGSLVEDTDYTECWPCKVVLDDIATTIHTDGCLPKIRRNMRCDCSLSSLHRARIARDKAIADLCPYCHSDCGHIDRGYCVEDECLRCNEWTERCTCDPEPR